MNVSGFLLVLLVSCSEGVPGSLTCDKNLRSNLAKTLSSVHILILRDVALSKGLKPVNWPAPTPNWTCKAILKKLKKLAEWSKNNVMLDFVLQYYQADIAALPVPQREPFRKKVMAREYNYVQPFLDDLERKNVVPQSKAFIKGKTLVASAFEMRPSVFVTLDKKSKQVTDIRGDCVEIFDHIKENVGFNYTVVPAFENSIYVNGTWRGVIGMLHRKEIDISLQPVGSDLNRFKNIAFTSFIACAPSTVLIPYPTEVRSLLASTWPFTLTVWLCIVAAVLVVTMGLAVAVASTSTNSTLIEIIPECALFTYGLLTCQGADCPGRTLGIRIIGGVWGLATLIFVYTYNSQLISYLTVPQLYPLVDSLPDLAYTNKLDPLIMSANSMVTDFLSQSSGSYRALGERIRSNGNKSLSTSYEGAVEKVATTGKYAFIINEYTGTYYANSIFQKTRKCSVLFVKQPGNCVYSHFVLQKNSLYQPIISAKLQQLIDSGITGYIMAHSGKGMLQFQDFCKVPVKDIPATVVLNLSQLQSAFAILGLGFTVAFLTFLCERLTKVRKLR